MEALQSVFFCVERSQSFESTSRFFPMSSTGLQRLVISESMEFGDEDPADGLIC